MGAPGQGQEGGGAGRMVGEGRGGMGPSSPPPGYLTLDGGFLIKDLQGKKDVVKKLENASTVICISVHFIVNLLWSHFYINSSEIYASEQTRECRDERSLWYNKGGFKF